jgi:hypothetical protein
MDFAVKYAPLVAALCASYMFGRTLFLDVRAMWTGATGAAPRWWKRPIVAMTALVIVAWVPTIVGYVRSPATTIASGPLSENDLPAPFARNQIIAPMYNDDKNVVLYTAELIHNGDLLRLFVDFSMAVPNNILWTQRFRVEITQFKNYVRGQRVIVPIISRYDDGNNKGLMRWGASPDGALPDNDHKFTFLSTMRARIALHDSDGTEQHHYFELIHGTNSKNELVPFAVAEESFDSYRGAWEQQDK